MSEIIGTVALWLLALVGLYALLLFFIGTMLGLPMPWQRQTQRLSAVRPDSGNDDDTV